MTRPAGACSADPGLQPERTALAWQRTDLALLLAAVTGARAALAVESVAGALACTVAGATALAGLLASTQRYRRSRRLLRNPTPGPLPAAAMRWLVVTTVLLGAAPVALVVSGGESL